MGRTLKLFKPVRPAEAPKERRWPDRIATLLFVTALVAIGLAVYRDYGIPWDEPTQRGYAQTVVRYAFRGDERLLTDPDRVYGPAHELLLLASEQVAHARDTTEIYAARHLTNFLVFVAGVALLYRLARLGSGTPATALLACAGLVLSPPIFAHAFYNSKDVPFLAAFVASMFTLLRLVRRPSLGTALLHAVTTSWLLAIRVPGILIPLLTVAACSYRAVRSGGPPRSALAGYGSLYLVLAAAMTYALWPTLWREPVAAFWNALDTMRRFPWEGQVLYGGRFVASTDLPWHYAPVWIAITTPLLYLLAFLAGVPVVARRVIREITGPSSLSGVYAMLVSAWLIGPLAAVIVLHSVLYDGWRQLFFVYPALLLIAAEGAVAIARAIQGWPNRHLARFASVSLRAGVLIPTGNIVRFMVQAHPHQQVFFNSLIGGVRGARFNYEMDYWGLSYRRGLEAIVARDRSDLIPVAVADPPGVWNARMLPYAERRRLVFVDTPEQARYFLGTYRQRRDEYPFGTVFHREEVEGAPILTVTAMPATPAVQARPAVTDARARNEAILAGVADAAIRPTMQRALVTGLMQFVRGAERLDVNVDGTAAELRQGVVRAVHVRLVRGLVGDFRRGNAGLPVDTFDVILAGVVLDLERMQSGTFRPVQLDSATINEIVIDGRGLNEALQQGNSEQKRLRVTFDEGTIQVQRSGAPALSATLRIWVGPDPWKPLSENLFFDLTELRAGGWRVPVAALLQRLVGDAFSPIVDPDQFDTQLSFGVLRLEDQQLRIGTAVR